MQRQTTRDIYIKSHSDSGAREFKILSRLKKTGFDPSYFTSPDTGIMSHPRDFEPTYIHTVFVHKAIGMQAARSLEIKASSAKRISKYKGKQNLKLRNERKK